MKIAILVTGNIRTWVNCQESFINTFLKYNPSIFFYTENLQYNYHPYIQKTYEYFEDCTISDIPINPVLKCFIKDLHINDTKDNNIYIEKFDEKMKDIYHGIFQNKKFKKAVNMMKLYEKKTNISFDIIIKTRFDCIYDKSFSLEHIINQLTDNNLFSMGEDHCFIGKRDIIIQIPLFTKQEYYKPSSELSWTSPPHGIFDNFVKTYNLTNNKAPGLLLIRPDKIKNIAICISGNFRNNDIQNFKINIIKPLTDADINVDIYISLWENGVVKNDKWVDKIDEKKIKDEYKPLHLNIESKWNNTLDTYTANNNTYVEMCGDTCKNASSMWYRVYDCFNLIKKSSVKYDIIFRTRSDIIYNYPIEINDVKRAFLSNALFMPIWNKKYPNVTKEMMDQFFFGTPDIMSKISNIFPNIKEYIKDESCVCTGEGFLYHHIKNQNIKIERFNISYDIMRINRVLESVL